MPFNLLEFLGQGESLISDGIGSGTRTRFVDQRCHGPEGRPSIGGRLIGWG